MEEILQTARVITVASGKGGVGKTNIVVNLGLALAKTGKRVLVLDADMGLGNLDVLLGITPRYNLNHMLCGEKGLSDIIVQGPGGIMILPSASGIQNLTELTDEQKLRILDEFDHLSIPIDFLLIDTAPGISSNVIYFTVASQEIIVVASPEPTSITDAYALIKVLAILHGEKRFNLLVNSVKTPEEGHMVYQKLSNVTSRFLDIYIEYLGSIFHDDHVQLAVRQQKAVFQIYPESSAGKGFSDLAQSVCHGPSPSKIKGNIQFFLRRLLNSEEEKIGGKSGFNGNHG